MNNQDWRPIETAPIPEFNRETWYQSTPNMLVWARYCEIAAFAYTKAGKGRWRSRGGNIEPTHWMPLPEKPL